MERKIYYNLAVIATVTAILTSTILVFLFYDFYRANDIKNSIGDLFLAILPAMIGLIVLILIFLYIISYIITSKIISPIKHASENIESIMTGEKIKDEHIYDELKPFIRTIEIQKREIEHSILQLKHADTIRRDFTANVSHELKTPLTSINGYAEMMANGMVKQEDIKNIAGIIHKEGIRLLELIDSIITLSHLDDRLSKDKDFEPLDIFETGSKVVSQLDPLSKEKEVIINLIGQSTIIQGNRRMIEDLMFNLLDNSIKYNKNPGKVDLIIGKADDFSIIRVKDTGIGIPIEDQKRIFERFYMADKSRSKKVNGTGLGLSIVKHIVEYHNGYISLESEPDIGTDIEIRFPI